MLIFKTVNELSRYLQTLKRAGRRIGFVPTMGALHAGHLSLVKTALGENDFCIVSIFVNPAQFNDPADLNRYPRTFERDLELLLSEGCHALFFPEVEEIYPAHLDIRVDVSFGFLFQTMEALHRPGHFEGVVKAVKRLLDIVEPHNLYMGQKDYQQFLIVQRMIEALHLPVRLVLCPTVREPDGLALSSRNQLLSPQEREAARQISRTLFQAAEKLKQGLPLDSIRAESVNDLKKEPLLQPEYFEIANAVTLRPLQEAETTGGIIICTAVKAGTVRLIDNVMIA
ncbi:MAG: pantothenate synthetase [Chitinophagales bacterium]|nr:MAG: pantothenate synthetase [Chitinophagales bacterium]